MTRSFRINRPVIWETNTYHEPRRYHSKRGMIGRRRRRHNKISRHKHTTKVPLKHFGYETLLWFSRTMESPQFLRSCQGIRHRSYLAQHTTNRRRTALTNVGPTQSLFASPIALVLVAVVAYASVVAEAPRFYWGNHQPDTIRVQRWWNCATRVSNSLLCASLAPLQESFAPTPTVASELAVAVASLRPSMFVSMAMVASVSLEGNRSPETSFNVDFLVPPLSAPNSRWKSRPRNRLRVMLLEIMPSWNVCLRKCALLPNRSGFKIEICITSIHWSSIALYIGTNQQCLDLFFVPHKFMFHISSWYACAFIFI